MNAAVDEGITSYCYQVCGSVGSAMCGSGRICQFGIDVKTQMPVPPEEIPGYGPQAPGGVLLVSKWIKRAHQLEESGRLPEIALAGAIRSLVPHWNQRVRQGATMDDLLSDMREIIENIEHFIDIDEFPL